MAEQDLLPDDGEEPTEVRRVRARDRKARLKSAGSLFPVEDEAAPPQKPPITPPEERFPPIPRTKRDIQKNIRPREANQPMVEKHRRRARRQSGILILLIPLILLGVGYFVFISLYPESPLNVLSPLPPPVIYVTTTPIDGASAALSNFPYALASPVLYRTDPNDCQFRISGSVQGESGQTYAVRVSSPTRDDGVLTGELAGYGEHGFVLNLPADTDFYTLELFDTDGTALAEPVQIIVSKSCENTQAIVNFARKEG